MTRISSGIDFCTTVATVTGTGAGAPPRPRPPPAGWAAFDASPPEQATSIKGAVATKRPRIRECEARMKGFRKRMFSISIQGCRAAAALRYLITGTTGLLEPKRFDRVERRGFAGRIEPKEHPGCGGESEGDRHGIR